MIDIKHKEDCTGCCACVDACSYNAISLQIDKEGFWYPHVNISKCVNCGLCSKICPVINNNGRNDNFSNPITYASFAKNIDIHFNSTTGGIYSVLAEEMLDKGGYVGGAIWTDDFKVKSIVSNNWNDLKRIRGSKYVQSNAIGLYSNVRNLLRSGQKVLICGSPCQIAGLKNYVGNKNDNLILVDFICHCINSPEVFLQYRKSLEKLYSSNMIFYHPKNKEYGGWHNFAFKAIFDNGNTYHANGINDDYTYCFIGCHVSARPSCYKCKFRGFPRYADITIADFWGIEHIDKIMDSNNGTSLVLLNSKKGVSFYESVRSKVYDKIEPLDKALEYNVSACTSPTKPKKSRWLFYMLLKRVDFHTLTTLMRRINKLLNCTRKISNKIRNRCL